MPRIEFGTWEEVEAMKIFYNTFISNNTHFLFRVSSRSTNSIHNNIMFLFFSKVSMNEF